LIKTNLLPSSDGRVNSLQHNTEMQKQCRGLVDSCEVFSSKLNMCMMRSDSKIYHFSCVLLVTSEVEIILIEDTALKVNSVNYSSI